MRDMGSFSLSHSLHRAFLCLDTDPSLSISIIAESLDEPSAEFIASYFASMGIEEIKDTITGIIQKGARDEYQFFAALRSPDIAFCPSEDDPDVSCGVGSALHPSVLESISAGQDPSRPLVGRDMARLRDRISETIRSYAGLAYRSVHIVSGPPGSGKSTLVSNVTRMLETMGMRVVSISDPREAYKDTRALFALTIFEKGSESKKGLSKIRANRIVSIDNIEWILGTSAQQDVTAFMLDCIKEAHTFIIESDSEMTQELIKSVSWVTPNVCIWDVPEYTDGEFIEIVETSTVTAHGAQRQIGPDMAKLVCEYSGHDVKYAIALASVSMQEDDLESSGRKLMEYLDRNNPRTRTDIERELGERVIGQTEVIRTLAPHLWCISSGFSDPRRPLGVLLFYGPSQVGKTEMAHAIADIVFEGKIHVEDMSVYFGEHYAASLIGAPPGYIGFQSKTPFVRFIDEVGRGVILLNEIEKADRKVKTVLMELFDTGILRDAAGNEHDARDILFIMTSNLTFSEKPKTMGFKEDTPEASVSIGEGGYRKEIAASQFFLPEELNRITYVLRFSGLSDSDVEIIARKHLAEMLDSLDPSVRPVSGISEDMVTDAMSRYREGGLRAMLAYVNTIIRSEIWQRAAQ